MSVILQDETYSNTNWGMVSVDSSDVATVTEQFSFAVSLSGTLSTGSEITLVEQNPAGTALMLTCIGLGNATGFILQDSSGNDYVFSNPAVAIGDTIDTTADGVAMYMLPGEAPCLLRGTRVSTVQGDVNVELLSVGDLVLTATGAPEAVVWIGCRYFDARRHPYPQHILPVRIRANAIGHNIPSRDLLVSPGHALYLDGTLVEAEQLINGATIIRDETIQSETYFHVELERYGVLLSEGLPSESYFDVGNRNAFLQQKGPITLYPDFSSTMQRNVRPIAQAMSASNVRAWRERLLARALDLGFRAVNEPDLVVVADGQRIQPAERDGNAWFFRLPRMARSLRLDSRHWTPADHNPHSQDRRRLGVCVRQLRAEGGAVIQMAGPGHGTGWYDVEYDEKGAFRWTTGSSSLPAGMGELTVDCAQDSRFWLPPDGGTAQPSQLRHTA